jgi:hypothetical protein
MFMQMQKIIFKASAELLQEVTKSYVCEAFMEWAGMDDKDEEPLNIEIPHANTNHLVHGISYWKLCGQINST